MWPLAIPILGVLAVVPSGCRGSDEPTFRHIAGCRVWPLAVCADARRPMVFRDGDPLLDLCAALNDGVGNRLWRIPVMRWGLEGITRVTAAYDAEGRVTAIAAECGLDEPFVATIEWDSDGRLARNQAHWDEGVDVETIPVYVDGKLAAHDHIYHEPEGVRQGTRYTYTLDEQGRITAMDASVDGRPVFRTFEYDGEVLASVVRDEVDIYDLEHYSTEVFSYDGDGRITGTVTTSDPDYGAEGPEVVEVGWTSSTEARVEYSWGSIDVETDATGRMTRKDIYSDGGHSSMTWDWDDDGRLVEFWMYGE